ncbi:MAG: Lrp/AsnC family transcriptional regulator [Planctomycetota bacterium]
MQDRLDRIDDAILAELQNDAWLSNKELAKRVHLAPSSCLERVRRLRELGALTGFHASVDPRALGIGIQALIAVQMRTHDSTRVHEFLDLAATVPEVVAVFYLAGKTDFLVHVAVADSDHLRTMAIDTIGALPEVAHVETSLIFDQRRNPVRRAIR